MVVCDMQCIQSPVTRSQAAHTLHHHMDARFQKPRPEAQGSVCGRTPICATPTILKIVDGLVGHAQATAQVRAPVRKPYVVRHKLGFVFCRSICCGASVVSVDSMIYFLQLEGAHVSPATGDLPNQNPSRAEGLVLQSRSHQKSAPQTNSKATSWQFGILRSPPPMNR